MYGDIGHGFILLLFATWMVWNERKLAKIKEEIFSIFFSGRYIILLMGLFSIYAGLIYNDVFSKSINLFGSGWLIQYNTSTVLGNTELQLSPATKEHTYAMGLDPVWQFAENQIVFLNSYKMKLSIILGVAHMLLGICMSVVNFVHLKKKLHILFDFVPQLIFLLFLFGYLVFMMFFKWIKYTDKSDELALKPGCAPSILIIFINMVLFGHTAPLPGCDEHMFKGQYELQIVLLVMALLCIPWMLFARPLYIRHQRRHGTVSSDEPFGEILIAQTIHTIEFVLSTVSHTASYLRIWALSLAHSQLSDVLWKKMLNFGFILPLGYFNVIAIFILFPVWAVLTLGILVVIEGLSAFLHTMRLHWVEFMSKFYKGEGYIYQPFAFKVLLQTKVE
ncbi:V-type proton ATPase 116 kDa subunit a-like [Scaptodrosophila lebanonensis]|uniref:V-type proton ATPase subunit a n=1 Tax=Drosophila lebanonensis TaxID=7225 RepID=A0A6J2U7Z7_DROLE|nr:V-type proton ATPase 116 kDa subunit a-like [Scaptodrosophila lebanonensis]